VGEYGWSTLYTYMKQNEETSCNCFKWGGEEVEGGEMAGRSNQCTNVRLLGIVTANVPCPKNTC
jgi:hypothetical protein